MHDFIRQILNSYLIYCFLIIRYITSCSTGDGVTIQINGIFRWKSFFVEQVRNLFVNVPDWEFSNIRHKVSEKSYCSGSQIFQKPRSHLQIFSCHKVDMKQIPHWGVTVLEWAVNLTVIGCFLLNACELIHSIVSEEKDWSNGTLNMRHNHTKFSCLGNIVPGICGPLSYWDLILQVRYCLVAHDGSRCSFSCSGVIAVLLCTVSG